MKKVKVVYEVYRFKELSREAWVRNFTPAEVVKPEKPKEVQNVV